MIAMPERGARSLLWLVVSVLAILATWWNTRASFSHGGALVHVQILGDPGAAADELTMMKDGSNVVCSDHRPPVIILQPVGPNLRAPDLKETADCRSARDMTHPVIFEACPDGRLPHTLYDPTDQFREVDCSPSRIPSPQP